VEVSIETVHTREKLVERIYDPDGRVEVSRQTQETVQSDQDTESQRVGAASNLPDFAANSGNGVTRENNENTETVNYQTSEINREVLISPDMIKHLSVAVLLNTRALEAPAGGTALVQDVEDLVASAIGLRPDRGDLITVKAMDFSDPRAGAYAPNQAPVSGAAPASQASYKLLATGLVLAVMLYFIFRPLLKASRPRMAPQPPRLAVEPSTSAPMPARVEETSEPGLLDRALSGGAARADPPPSGQDALSQLSQGMGARKEDILEILHTWLQGEKRVL
jgi:flagellar M-ring protein FliF